VSPEEEDMREREEGKKEADWAELVGCMRLGRVVVLGHVKKEQSAYAGRISGPILVSYFLFLFLFSSSFNEFFSLLW
jgi:hypothetical protein